MVNEILLIQYHLKSNHLLKTKIDHNKLLLSLFSDYDYLINLVNHFY